MIALARFETRSKQVSAKRFRKVLETDSINYTLFLIRSYFIRTQSLRQEFSQALNAELLEFFWPTSSIEVANKQQHSLFYFQCSPAEFPRKYLLHPVSEIFAKNHNLKDKNILKDI